MLTNDCWANTEVLFKDENNEINWEGLAKFFKKRSQRLQHERDIIAEDLWKLLAKSRKIENELRRENDDLREKNRD